MVEWTVAHTYVASRATAVREWAALRWTTLMAAAAARLWPDNKNPRGLRKLAGRVREKDRLLHEAREEIARLTDVARELTFRNDALMEAETVAAEMIESLREKVERDRDYIATLEEQAHELRRAHKALTGHTPPAPLPTVLPSGVPIAPPAVSYGVDHCDLPDGECRALHCARHRLAPGTAAQREPESYGWAIKIHEACTTDTGLMPVVVDDPDPLPIVTDGELVSA